MTSPTPAAPDAAPTGPTHGCARCGAPVGMGVGLCDRCNPLGLRDVAASQAHGTAILGVIIAIVLLAVVARLAISGIGPFPATIDSVVPAPAGLDVTLTITNEGASAGQTTCRISDAMDRGGGTSAFVLSPVVPAGGSITFSQVVTELGTEPVDLVVDCRTP